MWTREIDARIAKLTPDLETGFGVRFPKAPWLDEGHQGAVRTIDISYSKAEEAPKLFSPVLLGRFLSDCSLAALPETEHRCEKRSIPVNPPIVVSPARRPIALGICRTGYA